MGVLGLWQLIESAGRPVSLETLDGKVLAVDASILLNQAIKGMKDKQGRMITNAHLTVLFHRVCKLLFYRIKPIFVFDGGAPELKRRTLARRQQRRDQAAADMAKAGENALKNLLKQRALEEVLQLEPLPTAAALMPVMAAKTNRTINSTKGTSTLISKDMYELPPMPSTTLSIEDSSSDDGDGDEYNAALLDRYNALDDADEVDIDSSEFQSLPLEMQHEILIEVKDLRKAKRKVNWQDLPKSSDDFAMYQMSKLIKHSKLSQKITDLRKTMKSRAAGLMLDSSSNTAGDAAGSALGNVSLSYSGYDVDANRIASDDHSHYILLKGIRARGYVCNGLDAVSPSAHIKADACTLLQGSAANGSSVGIQSACGSGFPQTGEPTQLKVASESCVESSASLTVRHNGESIGEANPASLVMAREDSSSSERVLVTVEDVNELAPAAIDGATNLSSMRQEIMPHSDVSKLILHAGAAQTEAKLSQKIFDRDALAAALLLANASSHGNDKKASSPEASRVAPDRCHVPLATDDKILQTCPADSLVNNHVLPSTVLQPQAVISKDRMLVDGPSSSALTSSSSRHASLPICIESENGGETSGDEETDFVEVEFVASGRDTALHSAAVESEESKDMDSIEGISTESKLDAKPQEVGLSCTASEADLHNATGAADKADAGEGTSKIVGEWHTYLATTQSTQPHSPEGFKELYAYTLPQEDVHRLELALETERSALTKEQKRQETLALTVTDQMVQEAQELLRLFGVPYIVSPSEAEAQCAALEALGHCHGIVTDDSDVWLFGGCMVYRNFFKQDKFVELFKASDIENLFGLNRHKLIALALVSGSDYTDGIDGAGPVTAMEILSEFNGHGDGVACLKAFSDWWRASKAKGTSAEEVPKRQRLLRLLLPHDFPDDHIIDAYLQPLVDDSSETFSWASPELHLLRSFALERFGWQQSKTDDFILPVLQRLNQRQSQQRIDTFFSIHAHHGSTEASFLVEKFKSKRVKRAAKVLLGSHADDGLQGDKVSQIAATVEKASGSPSQSKRQKKTPENKGRSRGGTRTKRQKRTEGCSEASHFEAFSDDSDDALIMAVLASTGSGCAEETNCSNNSSACNLNSESANRGKMRQPKAKGKVKASAAPRKPTDVPVVKKADTPAGAQTKKGSKRQRSAASKASRLIQACVDLSESSSDSE